MLLLVAVGLLGPLALSTWAGWRGAQELKGRILKERETLARLVAERVSGQLSGELEALHAASLALSDAFGPGGDAALREAVRRLRARKRPLVETHFVVDAAGRLRVEEPPEQTGELDPQALLARVRAAGRPVVTDLVADRRDVRHVYLLVPVYRRPGELAGVLGAAVHPARAPLPALLGAGLVLEPDESVDLLDGTGVVVASTDASRRFVRSDHGRFIADLVDARRAASGDCHGCHGVLQRPHPELFAFAPLTLARWGVVVRQPSDAAYRFSSMMSRYKTGFGLLLLGLSLGFTYGAARSVTEPLSALTRAAERLAQGQLDEPVPPLPDDEVGRLGAAFEDMRVALQRSMDEVARANAGLEARVAARTAQLHEANVELARRDRDRRLALSKLLTAQEDERRRVARELHDDTCQSLAAMAMSLESAAAGVEDAAARDSIARAAGLARHALDEVHRMIVDLRPSVLDDLGLVSAIRWYVGRCFEGTGVAARCEFTAMEGRLPPEVELLVFRCAQGALTNVRRHAGAETVLVQLSRAEDGVTLEVEDDGRGFDLGALDLGGREPRGLGLLGMRERAELFDARFQVDTAPGAGTHVSLFVPLRAARPRAGEPEGEAA